MHPPNAMGPLARVSISHAVPDNRSVRVLAVAKTAESYAIHGFGRQQQTEPNQILNLSILIASPSATSMP